MERDKLLGTMDAKVWTDEFMATRARLGDKEFDHAMMLAWFANAIMAGFDEANRRAQRALDAEREKVKTLEEQLRLANCDQANTEADLNDVTAQLATLQAQMNQLATFLTAHVPGEPSPTKGSLGAVDCAIHIIINLQAQLRQVEGENELLKSGQRYMALEKERDTLRQLVEAFTKTTKGKLTINRYEHGGGRMFVDDGKNRDLIADTYNEGDREFITLCYEVCATLAAQDAGKHHEVD